MTILSRLGEAIAGPFRNADKINREVIITLLSKSLDKGTVLEVGPGYNSILEHLSDSYGKVVLDLTKHLDYSEAKGFKCVGQDANDPWQLEDNSVDAIVSNQCLEHLYNTDSFIKEAYRVLKKDGYFIISVPNEGSLISIFSLLFTVNPPMTFASDEYFMLGNPFSRRRFDKRKFDEAGHGHLRLFSTRAMVDLLKAHGFSVLKMHGGSWGVALVGKQLASVCPYYGIYTTVLAKK